MKQPTRRLRHGTCQENEKLYQKCLHASRNARETTFFYVAQHGAAVVLLTICMGIKSFILMQLTFLMQGPTEVGVLVLCRV